MTDLILMGAGVTPDLICDCADEVGAAEVRTKPGAVRFSGLSPMALRTLQRRYADNPDVDAITVPHDLSIRDFRVLALDMDGTLIQNECIDDMAAACGRGDEAAVTKAAMEGHLGFDDSLRKRVGLLKDEPAHVVEAARRGMRLQPGAVRLINFCRDYGIDCYIVSGGFTDLTRPLAKTLGMQGAISNELVYADNKLTGEVQRRRQAPYGGSALCAASVFA